MEFELGSVVSQHLLLALLPWLVAVPLGMVAGYGLAHLIRQAYTRLPMLRLVAILFPWRAIAVTLAAAMFFLPVGLMRFGLGTRTALAGTTLTLLAIALPFSSQIFLWDWYPPPFRARLVAAGRLLAVIAIALAVRGSLIAAGGAGQLIDRGIDLLESELMSQGFAIVGGLAVVVDVAAGFIQLAVSWAAQGGRSPA